MAENFWDTLMGTDEGAAQYMETYGEGPGCETRQIIAGLINPGESVLDVGCGPGWNYDHFLQHGPKVKYTGIDYSKRFIRVAKKRCPEAEFEVGDCRNLMFGNNSIDVVIVQDCLEHTNGYVKPMQEALRVAKKRVIVTFWKPFRTPGDGDQINDDGNDGYGANYEQKPWEDFLDSTGHPWITCTTSPQANRWHRYYVITKETQGE